MNEYLQFLAGQFGNPVAKFILEHGRKFTIGPRTYLGKRMEPKACFMNASHRAFDDPSLRYVEGNVTIYGVTIDHAWNVDRNDNLIDPTIDNHDGRITNYFGVIFATSYVRKTVIKNGYYGLLDYYHASKTLPALLDGSAKFAPPKPKR
jgi:hypothetical protein